MDEKKLEKDIIENEPITTISTRFGDMLLYDLSTVDDNEDYKSKLFLTLSAVVHNEEGNKKKELQPYYIEIPIPPYCKDRKKWGEEILLANKTRFLTLFFFSYVRCPSCKDPLPVMRDPLSELLYCPTCGVELK